MAFNSKDDVALSISDVQIGAVEGKDGVSDSRWLISAANTARAVGDMVLAVQVLDETGAVLSAGGAASTIADGADVTQGAKADNKASTTDATPISIVSILKQLSYMAQNPASRAVTGTFFQVTQPISLASAQVASGAFASGALATGSIAAGAVAAGAFVSGSILDGAIATMGALADAAVTATDTTEVSVISLLKQISKMEQSPATRAVTVIDGGDITQGAKADAKNSATDTTAISIMQVLKQISFSMQANSGNTEIMDDWDDGDKCRITPVATAVVTYGSDTLFDNDADNTAQQLKASSGNLYKLDVYNSNATVSFIQLFDLAVGDVTVGTTVPKYVVMIPAQGAASIDFNIPMSFSTAITYAAATTPTGNGDPTVGLSFSAIYK